MEVEGRFDQEREEKILYYDCLTPIIPLTPIIHVLEIISYGKSIGYSKVKVGKPLHLLT